MKLILTIFSFFLVGFLFSQDFNIRGFVHLKSTGEVAPFEKIKLTKQSDGSVVTGAITDVNGFFSIPKLDKGDYVLIIENYLYKKIEQKITVEKASGIQDFNFDLEKDNSVKEIDQVNVSADSKYKKTEVLISQIKLDKKGLERIPSMGAENDIVGALSVTPGVITTGDQGGQLYVRGGTPIQNKILLDGMTIYSPFHSIGFFSIFETELVKNADVYTGGFDAKFGGRISSVMDITYRDGNRKNFGGKISVSPFLAKAVLEGPFTKRKDGTPSKASYIFSGKHSLLDYTSRKLYPGINDGNGLPFNFTDLYGKITLNSDGGSKFSAFAFHNRDSVNYGIANINWTATGGGINFILVPSSSPIFIRGHVNGSNYQTSFNEEQTAPRTSSIGGFDLGFDFTYFLRKESEFNFGINIGTFNTKFETTNEAKQSIKVEGYNTEIGLYTNYRIVRNRWVIQPSVRAQVYATMNTISIEPRLGAKYNVNEKIRVKLSGGRYSQNFTSASSDKDVVNLFNGLLSAPTNVQGTFVNQYGKTTSPKNGIQYSWHAIVGTEFDLTKKWSVNLEGYYKYFPQLSNINVNKQYEDVAEFANVPDILKKDFLIESGVSYGADLLLKYSEERLFLWGVYSYGKSTRWDGVKEYYPVFDRRHNINLVGTYLLGKKKDLEVSVRWNLGSGLPFTPTSGNYQPENFSGGVTTDYINNNSSTISTQLGELNSQRLPYYHRLDITVKKNFTFKNKDVIEIIASVTNVYNRKNIFYINRVTQQTIYQFPILPSLGVSYKF
ncbi:MAG: TonB-dependent receptor plug domain-containing protein [Crocinitomicaceae bacterium]